MTFLFRRKKQADQHNDKNISLDRDYRAVAKTDVGSVRENNEDHLIFIRPFDKSKRDKYGCLALVADGMGGHSNGEIASRLAVDIISQSYFYSDKPGLETLKKAFEKANTAIYKKAKVNTSLRGMGTTCTAIILLNDEILIGHIGDSRAYLIKEDAISQLSKDDTYVQFLLDNKKITEQESYSHPHRNIVTKALGTSEKINATFKKHTSRFEENDKLLLCSDGLYEYMKAEELKTSLIDRQIDDVANRMIAVAKKRGGHDNISVLIVEAATKEATTTSKLTQKI